MIWLTWRQFRIQAAVVYAAVAVLAAVLAATGPQLADLSRTEGLDFLKQVTNTQQIVYYVGLLIVLLVPAAIGMFWGAPLISRELESGTHRLVWNQSITRSRWLATKLGLTGLATMAAAGAAGLAVSWWCAPIDHALNSGGSGGLLPLPRLHPLVFDARGVVPIAYAAFAFALGVTVGVLVRRAVPAMAITLAAFVAVQIAVPLWIRPHLVTPEQVTEPISSGSLMSITGGGDTITVNIGKPGAWLLSEQTLNASGQAAALPSSFVKCIDASTPQTMPTCVNNLGKLGYRQLATYQPAGNFWTLQWAETGLYLAAALALAAFCVWWVRRRLS